jgi:hypothetical protein
VKIIGIAGQLANGKDVLADYLVDKLNGHILEANDYAFGSPLWTRAAFANAVKKVYSDAFGVDREFIEKWKRIPEPPEGMLMNVRKGLQFIGDGFRQIKPDIWIEIALRTNDPIILSDSRYINEAKHIRNRGGINIVLWRPGMENNDPNPSESQIKPIVDFCVRTNQDGLISLNPQTQLAEFEEFPDGIQYYDYFMRNDGDLTALYRRADEELIPWILRRV